MQAPARQAEARGAHVVIRRLVDRHCHARPLEQPAPVRPGHRAAAVVCRRRRPLRVHQQHLRRVREAHGVHAALERHRPDALHWAGAAANAAAAGRRLHEGRWCAAALVPCGITCTMHGCACKQGSTSLNVRARLLERALVRLEQVALELLRLHRKHALKLVLQAARQLAARLILGVGRQAQAGKGEGAAGAGGRRQHHVVHQRRRHLCGPGSCQQAAAAGPWLCSDCMQW